MEEKEELQRKLELLEKKEQRRKTRRIIATIIAIILLLLLLCLSRCSKGENPTITEDKTTFDLSVDGNINDGEIPKDTTIVDRLNEQVAESMVNVSMNSNPTFVGGIGNVLITNVDTNHYPQIIEIYYGDEKIYQSGAIPVGTNITTAELDVDLPAGDYDCTAYFNSIDDISGELLGRVGINIKVTVQ